MPASTGDAHIRGCIIWIGDLNAVIDVGPKAERITRALRTCGWTGSLIAQ
jgi:hypothetical protein